MLFDENASDSGALRTLSEVARAHGAGTGTPHAAESVVRVRAEADDEAAAADSALQWWRRRHATARLLPKTGSIDIHSGTEREHEVPGTKPAVRGDGS